MKSVQTWASAGALAAIAIVTLVHEAGAGCEWNSDHTIYSCTNGTIGDPVDSTGGLVVIYKDIVLDTGDHHEIAAREPGAGIGVLMARMDERIPRHWVTTHSAGSSCSLALLANGAIDGVIPADAIPSTVRRAGTRTPVEFTAPSTDAGDSVTVTILSGTRIVASERMACGTLATCDEWPSGFSVRGRVRGVEYTWRLGASREIQLGARSVRGDRIAVTIRSHQKTIMPVLLQGMGLDWFGLANGGPVPVRLMPAAPSAAAR
jgi:hypothetical protein